MKSLTLILVTILAFSSCKKEKVQIVETTVIEECQHKVISIMANTDSATAGIPIEFHLPFEGSGEITIFDLMGRLLASYDIDEYSDDIVLEDSTFNPGMYICRFEYSTVKQIIVK